MNEEFGSHETQPELAREAAALERELSMGMNGEFPAHEDHESGGGLGELDSSGEGVFEGLPTNLGEYGHEHQETTFGENPEWASEMDELNLGENPEWGNEMDELNLGENPEWASEMDELNLGENPEWASEMDELNLVENPEWASEMDELNLGENPEWASEMDELNLGENPEWASEMDELNLGENPEWASEMNELNLGENPEWTSEMDEFGTMEFPEQGEEFFKRAFRKIGRFVKKAAPLLKKIASVAAPLVAKAVGGAFGGPAGAMIASKLTSAGVKALGGGSGLQIPGLGGLPMPGGISIPGLFEHQESSQEFQEAHHEAQHELAHELASHEAQAEVIAHFAAQSESHLETEALIGSAVAITLSPRERQALRTLLPALVRAAGIVTVLLRKQRVTRTLVRTVPTIVRRTARTLLRGAQSGKPITRARAARVMAAHTRQVLGSPRQCTMVIARNVRYARPLSRKLTRNAVTI